jgi:phosphate transport system substrate-binding protein
VKVTRRAAFAATALTSALVLAACGGSSDGGETTTPTNDPTTSAAPSPTETGTTAAPSGDCVDGSIKGAGSSAQNNAMTVWISAYQTQCEGSTIDYQSVGSGAGVEQFISAQTSFAGTDSAVTGDDLTKANERCSGGPAINLPTVGGAIAINYNLEGVDKLILTPDVMAGIFASTITKWNDKAIADLNPGVTLPDATIAQFHRSDSSGTTDNFTNFLTATAPSVWTFGAGKDWTAPGGQGAKGSEQIAASVEQTPNSIGYVELSYILEAQNAKGAWIDNGAGPVEPTVANASNAIGLAKQVGTGDDLALQLEYTVAEADAYPIVLVTYQTVCQTGLPADQNPGLVKSFLAFTASEAGQGLLTPEGYVPISGDLLAKIEAAISTLAS